MTETISITAPTRLLADLLRHPQRWLVIAIGVISVIASPRGMLLDLTDLPGVPLEFHAITISLAEVLLLGVLLLTAVRLALSGAYRTQLAETLQQVARPTWALAWIALALWMALSSFWALQPTMTRFVTLHAVGVMLLAILVADMVRHEGEQGLLIGLVLSGVFQTGIAIAQALNGNPLGLDALGEIPRFPYDTAAYYRAPGLAQHPNYLGGYLMLAMFAALLLLFRLRQRGARLGAVIAGLALGVCGVGLITTLSRSAIVGTAAGTLPLLVWLLRLAAPRTRRLIVGGALVLIVLGAGLAVIATRGDIVSRFFMGREFFFDWSWTEIQARPVIGAGAGNLMFAISERGVNERDVLPVHNVYLYVWGETGLIGMALFVLGCGSVLGVISQRPERLIWGGALLGLCVTMLFDNYWWAILPYRVLFFWVLGSWWGLQFMTTARVEEKG